MELEGRIINIVLQLALATKPMTSDELASILGVSNRTIREDINRNKKNLSSIGIKIKSHFRSGYSIEIEDGYQDNWQELLEEHKSIVPSETEDKIAYIMNRFIFSNDYLKLDDLCDELWISRSSMNRIFKEVRNKFAKYNLTINSKPAHGLKLVGKEMDKRICFVRCCIQKKKTNLDSFMKEYHIDKEYCQYIKHVVLKSLQKYNYKLTDVGFHNLIIHLLVAIERIKEKQVISTSSLDFEDNEIEYVIANDIVKQLENHFSIIFPKEEIEYVRIHLFGKKLTILDDQTTAISHEMEQIITLINEKIKTKLGYDFNDDFELFTLLSLHMMPLLVRIQYGLDMPNPILKDIKLKMAKGYECAVIAGDVILNQYHKQILDDELGYLALHYSMAIERLDEKKNSKNIVVVCSSGMATASLLKKRLMKKFNLDSSHVQVYDAASLKKLDLDKIDYIISTVKIEYSLDKPVIYMENLFDDIQLENNPKNFSIQSFLKEDNVLLQQAFNSKNEIINYMCDYIEQKYTLDFSLKELIYQREELSSTEVGNLVAMPHPTSLCTDESIIMLVTLKKSILWQNNYVKYIFLICGNQNSKEESEFINEHIIDLIMNQDWLAMLNKVTSYDELVQIL